MRRKQNEIIDRKLIEEILSNSEVCRIAMMDVDRPYIVPLNYGYKDNALYIHSAPLGKKIDLLKQNNKVCFEMEETAEVIKHEIDCEWSAKYRSVVGYGTVEFITDTEEKKSGLDVIMSHYGKAGANEYKTKNLDFVVILKVHIEEVSGKQSSHWNKESEL